MQTNATTPVNSDQIDALIMRVRTLDRIYNGKRPVDIERLNNRLQSQLDTAEKVKC